MCFFYVSPEVPLRALGWCNCYPTIVRSFRSFKKMRHPRRASIMRLFDSFMFFLQCPSGTRIVCCFVLLSANRSILATKTTLNGNSHGMMSQTMRLTKYGNIVNLVPLPPNPRPIESPRNIKPINTRNIIA